jgi:hypothetical protein
MSALSDALFRLRVSVLCRLAERKNLIADAGTISALARDRSDSAVLSGLQRRTPKRFWLWAWLGLSR